MKTLEMEIALMRKFDVRRNIIVPNICWGMNLHECDLLSITKKGYATEIEIKVSKPDLRADRDKTHGHRSNKIEFLELKIKRNKTEE